MTNERFLRLGKYHRIGFEPPSSPNVIPPDPEYTTYVPAGVLSIGVECRILPAEAEQFKGPSIHVCEASTGTEYLRFDLLEGLPHYHYIDPGVSDTVVAFDDAACGDMWPWVLQCLCSRLPAMLEQGGMDALAAKVDLDAVAAALPQVIELVLAGYREDIPELPEWSQRAVARDAR